MATPASIRLPIRSLLRSSTASRHFSFLTLRRRNREQEANWQQHANPTAKIQRTQCCSQVVAQTQSKRGNSTVASARTEATSADLVNQIRGLPKSPLEQVGLGEEKSDSSLPKLQLPRNVTAAYMRPLRKEAEYGIPSCDLQLRSYSVRNLEFFADFAMRAAYYLNLPAYGPIPLPRITERWTVPLGHFIHKKSQENFERKTLRRMIQIKDGNEETVGIWLAFLAKHAYYGVGMKANVWSFDKLGVGKHMDAHMEEIRPQLEDTLDSFAFDKRSETAEKVLEVINRDNFRAGTGAGTPMQESRTAKINESRPWKHPNMPSVAAQRAVRKGV